MFFRPDISARCKLRKKLLAGTADRRVSAAFSNIALHFLAPDLKRNVQANRQTKLFYGRFNVFSHN